MIAARPTSIGLLMVIVGLIAADLGIVRALGDGGPTWPMFAIATFPMVNLLLIAVPKLRRGYATRPYWIGFEVAGWVAVVGVGWLYWSLPFGVFFWPILPVHAWVLALDDSIGFAIEVASAAAFYFGGQLLLAVVGAQLSARYRVRVEIGRRSATVVGGSSDEGEEADGGRWAAAGDLPHFDPDLDGEGAEPPAAVADFRARLRAADAVLISSPEYIHGVPGAPSSHGEVG